MNLTPKAVKTLGVLVSLASMTATALLVIIPLQGQIASDEATLEQSKIVTMTKEVNYERLKKGEDNLVQAQEDATTFHALVANTKNIESASRAITSARNEGVKINSFNFLDQQEVIPIESPGSISDGYQPPQAFNIDVSHLKPQDASESGSGMAGYSRIPAVIEVTAVNYESLSTYLNDLAHQPRLLTIISVDSSKTQNDGDISATIYAYAFVYPG